MNVLAAASPWTAIAVSVAFLMVAVGLFFLEVFFPSFGLMSLVAAACIAVSIISAFSVGRLTGFIFIGLSVLAIPGTFAVGIKLLGRTSLVLKAPKEETAPEAPAPEGRVSPGMRGVTVTPLRPSGVALLGGRKVSVVTGGESVEPNEQIEVAEVEGTRTIVRPVREG